MYYVVTDGNLIQVDLKAYKAKAIVTQAIGDALIEFYNFFSEYRIKPGEQLLTLYDMDLKDAEPIIRSASHIYSVLIDEEAEHNRTFLMNHPDMDDWAVSSVRGEIQRAFTLLDLSLSLMHGQFENDTERFEYSDILFDSYWAPAHRNEGYTPVRYETCFALYDDKLVQVFNINSLYSYLCLDFYYTFFDPSIKKIAICPCCGKAFRLTRTDQRYCNSYCKEKSFNRRHNQNPYFGTYRYMQQYCNRQLNEIRDKKKNNHPTVIAMEEAYNKWMIWAKQQRDSMIYTPDDDVQAIRKAFRAKLTAKWKELTKGIEK